METILGSYLEESSETYLSRRKEFAKIPFHQRNHQRNHQRSNACVYSSVSRLHYFKTHYANSLYSNWFASIIFSLEVALRMEIDSLVNNPYLILLVVGVITYLGTIFFFVEKAKNKLLAQRTEHDSTLVTKYANTPATIRSFIEMFDSLRENRFKYDRIKRFINFLHWTGIAYLISTVGGFILQQSGLNEGWAIVPMGLSFIYFFIDLILLIVWYHRIDLN